MKDSVLAWRLTLKTKCIHTAWSIPLQVVFLAVFAIAVLALIFEVFWPRPTALFFAVASGVLAAMNYRTETVDDIPRPIFEEHPVWGELVEKLAHSPCEEERDHVFLGTICEEYES